MKNCGYNPRVVLQGSRDKLCINDQVKFPDGGRKKITGQALNLACSKAKCKFKLDEEKAAEVDVPWEPIDIEDLHRLGKSKKFCPYYLNKHRVDSADIVFMPYNYVADARIRSKQSIDLNNDILIIDEAHNIAQVVEDSSSFKLSVVTFRRVLRELNLIKEEAENRI